MQFTIKQYVLAELKRQWLIIAKSKLAADMKLFGKLHAAKFGLSKDDPPELARFVIGRSEKPDLTTEEKKKAKVMAERIRQLDPEFTVTPETDKEIHDSLGTPTLRETVQRLADRIQDDRMLATHLSKLLDLYKREPVTQKYHDQTAAHAIDGTHRLLIQNWIQDPPKENWATASFCFFSDRAMAKLVFFLSQPQGHRKELTLHKLPAETERIKILHRRLHLVPARPRLIKDIEFRLGQLRYIPFKSAVRKRN